MRFLLLALLSIAIARPALAWGLTGHRVTGAIADAYLGPKARAVVHELLGTESLAEAANWADLMRSDPAPFWQQQSLAWHYVTVPAGTRYGPASVPQGGDALTALKAYSAMVNDPAAPLEDRQGALRFILHIIGDLAQPLHVGRADDRGGNVVKLTFFGAPTNLHTLWNSTLIDHQKLAYTEWRDLITRRLTPDELRQWSSADPQQWVADSVTEREALYPAETDLRYEYVFAQNDRLNRQLAKGGLRIAAYLNQLFDAPRPEPRRAKGQAKP